MPGRVKCAEAARILGVCPETVRRWISAGVLHGVQVGLGRRWYVDADSLDECLQGVVPEPDGLHQASVRQLEVELRRQRK